MKRIIILINTVIIICCCVFCFVGCQNQSEPQLDVEFVADKYHLDIKVGKTNQVECAVQIQHMSHLTAENIVMQCTPLAYQDVVCEQDMINQTYPNGVNFGKFEMKSAQINGEACDFAIENQACNLVLNHPIKYGESVVINIEYCLTLANLKHRLGYYNGFYSLTGFYPYVCAVTNGAYVRRPYSKIGEFECLPIADFFVDLQIPKGNVIIHTGDIVKEERNETTTTYKIQATNVRDFALMYSKNLTMRSKTSGLVTHKYYFANDTTPFKELDLISNAVNYFSDAFGTYEHNNISVVLAPFAFGGMEYSEVVVVSDALKEQSRNQVIVHEIAHQWWYMRVGSDQAQSPWMDESLAEFSVALYYLKSGYGNVFESMRQQGLQTLEKRTIKQENCRISGSVYDFDEQSYAECVYTLGCLMWINYYSIKGPALIDDLKAYASNFNGKIATENDIAEHLFKGYQSFMNGWLEGNVVIG